MLGFYRLTGISRHFAQFSYFIIYIRRHFLKIFFRFVTTQVKYDGRITYDVASFALDLLEVDQYGLDKIDRRILQTLIVNFQGGPVGLETLAAAIGEDAGTLEDVYEPYLLQNGFLNRTPRGRTASSLAYEHLGFEKNS